MSHYPDHIRLAAVQVWTENHNMSLTEALFYVLDQLESRQ